MINLNQFLKSVDAATAEMSREKLEEVIHDIARTLPEKAREDFLIRLDMIHGMNENAETQQENSAQDFEQTGKLLKEKLECIENGELTLEGCINEEYDDWYDSSDDEFLYSDPRGVLDIIESACRFVHQCIEHEAYKAGAEIARILIGLEIMVDGEYQEYMEEPIDINDLGNYHLGNVDYRTLVIDAAHAAYCASELPDRADELYRIMYDSGRQDISLEMVMQSGRELPDRDAFLELWIEYLGSINTDRAEKLLREALELAGGGPLLLESARKYGGIHPELYEQYLTDMQGKADAESLLEVGAEAVDFIGKKELVRSRIALLTGEIALGLDRQEEAEKYWLEAFRSDTRVVNYLRLAVECRDFSGMRKEAAEIYRKRYPKITEGRSFIPLSGGGKENQADAKTVYMLAFLGGEFSFVREKAMSSGEALGWSASFMKCGLAAFLLLLSESSERENIILQGADLHNIPPKSTGFQSIPGNAGKQNTSPEKGKPQDSKKQNTLSAGGREMLRQIVSAVGFKKADYEKGTLKNIAETDEEWFWNCWQHWRKTVSITAEERAELFQWVEELITMRVKGIMEGNHRKYYRECAAYIAVLGEAKESGGEQNGKQNTMMKYMNLYPRRSAFREDLQGFGMKDYRKK